MTSLPDILRLLAIPAFAWIALLDYRTRRVPSKTWYPLAGLAIILLLWDGAVALGDPSRTAPFLFRVGLSLAFLVPFAYLAWWFGLFGGADRRALVVLALLFPTYPAYQIGPLSFPLAQTAVGVFSITILTNGVLGGLAYPVGLVARNALAGRFSPVMAIGRPVVWSALPTTNGKLLETDDGFTASGLDLDALRMYLRWRRIDLADVRNKPDLRDPATLPQNPAPPTDGAVDPSEAVDPRADGGEFDDPWGAAAFLDTIEGSAYGSTPDRLRAGLDLVAHREVVWVSPGIPFLVPLFVGLVVAITYGDVLFVLLALAGLV